MKKLIRRWKQFYPRDMIHLISKITDLEVAKMVIKRLLDKLA